MKKVKFITILFIVLALMLIIPNVSNATEGITVTRNVYAQDGSMKFTFTGLTIDATHEYKYGLTQTLETEVEEWYSITEKTDTSATANIMTGTQQMLEVINEVDTGYITIKDTTTNTVVLEPYAVDLKLPYLRVTNYEVVSNGQNLDGTHQIDVPLRNVSNSEAYYQYEKITDQNLINKYKEIKANSGDYNDLESLLKTSAPTSGYSNWEFWTGYGGSGRNGYGYTTRTVNVPDQGLYYLWVYFSGASIKDLYGCILVDNLQPDIAVDSISLPATETLELGKTITLNPTFNPSTATNKIVTWTSSDEEVATVDNTGKITPKKVGSTIITVIAQDGNKKATCTVTVTNPSSDGQDTNKKTFGDHTYSIIEKTMTWEEAKEYCESLGGYLVTITSADEQLFIESFIKEKGLTNNRFWIGATDEEKEGTWKWITEEKFSYANWGETQPNNGEAGGQNYGVFVGYDTVYNGKKLLANQWDDINNGKEEDIYFICEWGEFEKETTIAPGELPKAGIGIGIALSIIAVIVTGVLAYSKYNKIKEI